MSEIVRHIEGFGTMRAVAYWLPVRWIEWDDAGVMPAGVPEFMWTEHHGHRAAMRQSAFGVHAFRCSDCDTEWREIEAP